MTTGNITAPPANTDKSGGTKNYRLPASVLPEHYTIELKPDLQEFSFAGFETIKITIKEKTNRIILNALDLTIADVSLRNASGDIRKGVAQFDEESEFAMISFDQIISEGTWELSLSFDGILNDKLKGFYRSFFDHETLGKTPIAVTQFESTDARRCFPCFDEPQLKATFKIFLTVPEDLEAISNGRKLRETIAEESLFVTKRLAIRNATLGMSGAPVSTSGTLSTTPVTHRLKRVEFAETMKMSTYLVAIVVGRFVGSPPVIANGKELRIWCTPGKEKLTDFAMRVAEFGVRWYEEFFAVAYPGGDKIDFIAIPDFAAGAMENLGCITFRETALLLDEKTATHAEMARVAVVVLHELAHMWFGDLVTMTWWTWLWLNESFATFMEQVSLDDMRPAWHVWDDFAMSRAAAMRVDSLKSTHPIECPVEHPEETRELFDVISYEKGCAVLYVLYNFIGRQLFRSGVSSYLKKFSYGNAEGKDLWDCLQAACEAANEKHPVRKIMDAWILTPGHPLVKASLPQPGQLKLQQHDFKFLREAQSETVWPVPVHIRARLHNGTMQETRHLLSDREQVFAVPENLDYLVVNAGGSGFYRVVYTQELLTKLKVGMQAKLSVVERFNLVNDAWACVRSGISEATDYLEFIKTFADETSPQVWNIILASLRTIFTLIAPQLQDNFAAFLRGLLEPIYERLGWTPAANEDVQTRELRGSIITALGTLAEHSAVRKKAKELFTVWKQDRSKIDNNVFPAIVATLAYNGDQAQYDEFFALYKAAASKTPQDEQRFLASLGGFRRAPLYMRTIEATLSEHIRTQDAPFLLAGMLNATDAEKRLAVWNFIKTNWQRMVEKYPGTGVVRMASNISALDTPELEKDINEFFALHPVDGGTMAMNQASEQLRVNVLLRRREAAKLSGYMKAFHP